jgi:hypothetical protein
MNMDAERFDGLVRTFGQTKSRRQTLRGLAGAAAAGAFALGGQAASGDACKRTGKPCKKNGQCCSNNCVGGTGSGSTGKSEGRCRPACLAPCAPIAACNFDTALTCCSHCCFSFNEVPACCDAAGGLICPAAAGRSDASPRIIRAKDA